MNFIVNILKGTAIGIANAVPGVSGGTLAVILKIYDKLLGAIDLNIKKIKENFGFLVSVVIGMVIGIILTSKVLSFLFENYNKPTQFFFIGIILGSMPMIYRETVKERKLRTLNIIPFICGFAGMLAFTMLTKDTLGAGVSMEMSVGYVIYLVFAGFIAAVAMVLPGLSGSMVMKVLGAYDTVISNIDIFTSASVTMSERISAFWILVPAGIGIAAGIFAAAKIISLLLKKFRQGTYCVIAGLMIGSLYAVYINAYPSPERFAFNGEGVIAVIVMIVGAAIPILMELPSMKKKEISEAENA